MININLIIRPEPKINWRRVGILVLAGALLMGFGLYGLTWWQDYNRLKADVAGLQPLELTYRKVIAESGNLKEREDALQRQEKALAQIGRNQAPAGQAAILQAVFATAPADVVVTDVSIDKDQGLLLSGQAPTADAAFRYLQALQKLPGLTAVEERKLATIPKSFTTFTFAARVKREGTP